MYATMMYNPTGKSSSQQYHHHHHHHHPHAHRHHKSSTHINAVMKPPKPPSWRDFIGGSNNELSSAKNCVHSDFTDLSRVKQKSSSGPTTSGYYNHPAADFSNNAVDKKRVRASVHRTRSEKQLSGLPSGGEFAISLADLSQQGDYLLRSDRCDYRDENNHRCEKWLAEVHAANYALEDAVFAEGSGVEIEVPDEGHWTDLPGVVPHRLKSSDTDRSKTRRDYSKTKT
ncbi:uncharacterized protein LOC141907893 [Tubulanus polymorphus]|uniref:uncharacterized protein LOC141907893 n=1 Tax=Tubulanus polymorphus TaxID=672921 RepID=UPI003DA49801